MVFKLNKYGIQYINDAHPSPGRLRAMKRRCALRGAKDPCSCDCVGYRCKVPGSSDLLAEQIDFDAIERLPESSPFKDV